MAFPTWRDESEWFGRWQHRSMPVPLRSLPALSGIAVRSRGIFRVTASTSALRLATALAPRPRFFRSPGRAFFFVRTAIVVSSPRSPLVAWFRRDGMVRARFLLEDPGFGSPPAVDARRTRRWESRHAFFRPRDGPQSIDRGCEAPPHRSRRV